MSKPIEILHLPNRTYQALLRADIKTVEDLLLYSQIFSFDDIKGIGIKGVYELEEALHSIKNKKEMLEKYKNMSAYEMFTYFNSNK